MKKTYFLLFILSLIGMGVQAQYIDIHDFNGAQGSTPEGSLILVGNKLYGMTYLGGANNDGCVFSLDTTGGGYRDILDFTGANGKNPYYGTLAYSEGVLYGMTYQGGTNNDGCIFSIDTGGTQYKDLHDFNSTAGKEPQGSLTLLGKTLFGMTYYGGANTDGCIFSIDTNGSGYKDIFDFGGTNGSNPMGDLTASHSGKVLYGTTVLGGLNGDGCVFSVDTNGSNYKDVFDFNDQSYPEGANPPGILTLLGNRLFGMATNGGSSLDDGLIFSIDTNGTGYKIMFEFGGTNGELPQGSLTLSGTVLYGMATYGAGLNDGCIFSIDTSGSTYNVLLNFNSTNCFYPYGSLTLSGDMAYGTATRGGSNSDGVVFGINYKLAGIENLADASSGATKIYPNPNNGNFTLALSHSELVSGTQTIEVYNVLGEEVYTATLKQVGNNTINISNEPNGIYFYRFISGTEDLTGEGKLIIQK